MPNLFSYIICHDVGAAPNAENNLLSLAICKPQIRQHASVGDYLIAFSGSQLLPGTQEKRIIFVAQITEKITMNQYATKYPTRTDSIYTPCGTLKNNPYHNKGNVQTDLSGKFVLLSTNFIYFGKKHISVPQQLANIIPGRGYQKDKNAPFISSVQDFMEIWKTTYGFGKLAEYTQSIVSNCKTKSSIIAVSSLSC